MTASAVGVAGYAGINYFCDWVFDDIRMVRALSQCMCRLHMRSSVPKAFHGYGMVSLALDKMSGDTDFTLRPFGQTVRPN